MPPKTKHQPKKAGRNALCECGSGKKGKKCCLLHDERIEDAPIDAPHVCFSYHCLNNIWERFPDSKSTPEYWQTKEELDAFNELLTVWMGIPASDLVQHGVRTDSYNAISQIQQQVAVTKLLNATKDRVHIDPSVPGGYFRSLGEMARIFHKLRLTLLLDDVFLTSTENEALVREDILQEINSFRNMLLVGVHNKTLEECMQENPHYQESSNKSMVERRDTRRYILIDIAKKRVHEVPIFDPNHDVLFWKRSTSLHYSQAFLGHLARHIDNDGEIILPTNWLCDLKVHAMMEGNDGTDELIQPFGTDTDDGTVDPKYPPMPGLAKGSRLMDLLRSDSDSDGSEAKTEHHTKAPKKDWVYIRSDGHDLKYHPTPSFKWTIKEDKGKIVGYLLYLSAVFGPIDTVAMSPVEWLRGQHGN